MDPKKFQQAVDQHAEWFQTDSDSITAARRSTNPTARIQIREMKPPQSPCDACGRELETHRRVLLQRRYDTGGWTERCNTCKKYRNALTGEFSVGQVEALDLLRQKYNGPKRTYRRNQNTD